MYFLGIDPGYGRLGYGVVESESKGQKPRYVTSGVIETSSKLPEEKRLVEIESAVIDIIKSHPPEYAAVEQVFFKKDLTTGVQLIQARGVILLCLGRFDVKHKAVSPTSLKKTITGNGRADKKQITLVIQKLMGIEKIPGPDDAADGLSLAVYAWLSSRSILKK